MSKVYFRKVKNGPAAGEANTVVRDLLGAITKEENITFEKTVPLKVHFGERGNVTFIRPENYDGIIDFLVERVVETFFIETNVMYAGSRHRKDLHLKTACEHGFTRIPVVIADGNFGEDYSEVEINKSRFKTCKLGKEFLKYRQLIVVSHFKGHMFAGFGGAIKQLSMGFASKGGKIAMHMGTKPRIRSGKCGKCGLCLSVCNENAITINAKKSFIDHDRCVGCGACVGACPRGAASVVSVKGALRGLGFGSDLIENMAEYALAAHRGRKNIYVNFNMNITSNCDCDSRKMKPLMKDIGVFASLDPVAIDKACWDTVAERGRKFKGARIFTCAEKTGLGSSAYEIKEI